MSTAKIVKRFDEHAEHLRDSGELAAVRRAALERLGELGLPSRRVETWRYTDLSQLGERDLCYCPPQPDENTIRRAKARIDELDLPADRQYCIFVDGRFVNSLSTMRPDPALRIEIATPRAIQTIADSALGALNTAFATEETLISVSDIVAAPVELLFIGSSRQLAPQIKLKLELAAGAKATIIQRFVDLPEASECWLNLVTEIDLKQGSELSLLRLQEHATAQYQTTLNRVGLEAGAKLDAGSIELGGAIVRNEFEIELNGSEAEAIVFGLSVTSGSQHSDTRIAIDHRAPDTSSRQDFRAIVDDASRSVFNGKVSVQEHAQHIDARQRNDNLLLSAKAEVDTKPELEIYADQVVCSHGATVGELSQDHLFYLRARGIDAAAARSILTTAFANTILQRIGAKDFRDHARAAVDSKLAGRTKSP